MSWQTSNTTCLALKMHTMVTWRQPICYWWCCVACYNVHVHNKRLERYGTLRHGYHFDWPKKHGSSWAVKIKGNKIPGQNGSKPMNKWYRCIERMRRQRPSKWRYNVYPHSSLRLFSSGITNGRKTIYIPFIFVLSRIFFYCLEYRTIMYALSTFIELPSTARFCSFRIISLIRFVCFSTIVCATQIVSIENYSGAIIIFIEIELWSRTRKRK